MSSIGRKCIKVNASTSSTSTPSSSLWSDCPLDIICLLAKNRPSPEDLFLTRQQPPPSTLCAPRTPNIVKHRAHLLSSSDIASCARVSRAWYHLWTPELWRQVILVSLADAEKFFYPEAQAAFKHLAHHIHYFYSTFGLLQGPILQSIKSCQNLLGLQLLVPSLPVYHERPIVATVQQHTEDKFDREATKTIVALVDCRHHHLRLKHLTLTVDSSMVGILEWTESDTLESLVVNFDLSGEEEDAEDSEEESQWSVNNAGIIDRRQERDSPILRSLKRFKAIEFHDYSPMTYTSDPASVWLFDQFPVLLPNLIDLVWDDRGYTYHEVLCSILKASRLGWRKIHLLTSDYASSRPCINALQFTVHSLESLIIERNMWDIVSVHQFLEQAVRLKEVKIIESSSIFFSGYLTVDFTPEEVERPWWGCTQLQVLQVPINGITRLDVLQCHLGEGTIANAAGDRIVDPDWATEPSAGLRAYDQLARLVHLHELRLGKPRTSERYWSQKNPRVLPPFLHMCLPFSMESGLARLESLKELRILDVSWMAHRIDVPELEWMHLNWPKLERIDGLLDPREWAEEGWKAKSKILEVENWIVAHPKGIGCSYYAD
ncbi:hypothetical protein BGZ83_010086 [Gryganskiella cystojenkinii]|nr:hypothetical protein BGZ83_010086 [Gryganskiella cystojenkinii]